MGAKGNRLHIGQRLGRTQDLHADLVELAHPALLRPLVAEHRPVIEQLHRQGLLQPVADEGPGHPGRVLRPQRELLAATVGEGVHFLGHDVGRVAQRAGEHVGELEDRGLDLGKAVARRQGARGLVDMAMAQHVLAQKVVGAADGAELAHRWSGLSEGKEGRQAASRRP
jgi:hypothetical protein